MTKDEAEQIAIDALAWLATDPELLGVFLGATGAAADDLRARADDPAFLGSVLDFLVMDDAWVIGFCDAEGLNYERPLRARAVLNGEEMHWT